MCLCVCVCVFVCVCAKSLLVVVVIVVVAFFLHALAHDSQPLPLSQRMTLGAYIAQYMGNKNSSKLLYAFDAGLLHRSKALAGMNEEKLREHTGETLN